MGTVAIPLTRGFEALVDEEDVPLVGGYSWNANRHHVNKVYAVTTIKRADGSKTVCRMHRLILNAPPGVMVDHINHDGLDNRRENLRLATNAQNNVNSRPHKGKRFKGTTYEKAKGKWVAQAVANRQHFYLGRFDLEEDAARAYDAFAIKTWGEFANTNFGVPA